MSDMVVFSCFVYGAPRPKGSMKAFARLGKDGKPFASVVHNKTNELAMWENRVASVARESRGGDLVNHCRGIAVDLVFSIARPKSHYGTGKNSEKMKSSAPIWHTKKPDIDKLSRAVLDALTGVVWGDDSQVCKLNAVKTYVGAKDMEGVDITVYQLDDSL